MSRERQCYVGNDISSRALRHHDSIHARQKLLKLPLFCFDSPPLSPKLHIKEYGIQAVIDSIPNPRTQCVSPELHDNWFFWWSSSWVITKHELFFWITDRFISMEMALFLFYKLTTHVWVREEFVSQSFWKNKFIYTKFTEQLFQGMVPEHL